MNEQVSQRRFKVWDYNVSHNQLLIRSPKTEEFQTNIDIIFFGVSYLNLPTTMHGISLCESSVEEVNNIQLVFPNKSDTDKVFVLSSLNNKYMVVAKSCKILENELDIFETSLEIFGHEFEKWEKLKTAFHDEKNSIKNILQD